MKFLEINSSLDSNWVVCWIRTEAESTVTKAQIYEDEGHYAKASLLRADSPKSDNHHDESDSKPLPGNDLSDSI